MSREGGTLAFSVPKLPGFLSFRKEPLPCPPSPPSLTPLPPFPRWGARVKVEQTVPQEEGDGCPPPSTALAIWPYPHTLYHTQDQREARPEWRPQAAKGDPAWGQR